jgi:hypothetical protein
MAYNIASERGKTRELHQKLHASVQMSASDDVIELYQGYSIMIFMISSNDIFI